MKRKISILQAVVTLLTTTAIAVAIYGEAARAQGAGTTGCIANGSCNGNVIKNRPNDVWHNYVCLDCHSGRRPANLALSPQEVALVKNPPKFWALHDQLSRDRETRANAQGRAALKAPLAPDMVRLIAQRPGAKK